MELELNSSDPSAYLVPIVSVRFSKLVVERCYHLTLEMWLYRGKQVMQHENQTR